MLIDDSDGGSMIFLFVKKKCLLEMLITPELDGYSVIAYSEPYGIGIRRCKKSKKQCIKTAIREMQRKIRKQKGPY